MEKIMKISEMNTGGFVLQYFRLKHDKEGFVVREELRSVKINKKNIERIANNPFDCDSPKIWDGETAWEYVFKGDEITLF